LPSDNNDHDDHDGVDYDSVDYPDNHNADNHNADNNIDHNHDTDNHDDSDNYHSDNYHSLPGSRLRIRPSEWFLPDRICLGEHQRQLRRDVQLSGCRFRVLYVTRLPDERDH
jgi:hypothetical protein